MREQEYEIAGVVVCMTPQAAARWNAGDWTDDDDQAAKVCVPDEYCQASSLRDGEVVLCAPWLVRASYQVSMREAIRQGVVSDLAGYPANWIAE